MPAPAVIDEFLELGYKSGILNKTAADAYLAHLQKVGEQTETPQQLADAMVRDGLMTHFQAENLLQGKWRGFLIGGKYRLLQRIGSGGMGCVYLCEHVHMRRRVAIKVLPLVQARDPAALERFYREARAVAALDHPNIVRAHDIDREDNLHFLVMEFVDGSSLQEVVRRGGPLTPLRAAHYIRQAAFGLEHAHEAGLVHRDVKPGNLILDRGGTVKVLDLGLARFFNDRDDSLTKKYDESVLGTADYLAPEQALDTHNVDIRVDVYSLGATFYYLLVGKGPFEEGTVAQKLIWHQVRQPVPVARHRPDVPAELLAVIEKMMAKDRDRRYQTPAEVAEALAPFTETPIPPPPEDEMPRLSPAAQGTAADTGPRSPVRTGRIVPASGASSSPTADSPTAIPRGAKGGPRANSGSVVAAAQPEGKSVSARTPTPPMKASPQTSRNAIRESRIEDRGSKQPSPPQNGGKSTRRDTGASILNPQSSARRIWWRVGIASGAVALCYAIIILWAATRDTAGASRAAHGRLPVAEIRRFLGHTAHVDRVAYLPDGRRVLSVSHDRTMRLWDTETGKELHCYARHDGELHFVAVSSDGKRAVTSSSDKTIRLWDVETGEQLRVFRGHESRVWGAVFTPDDRHIFSGGDDKTARLWDVATGQEKQRFIGHEGTINSVAVAPDGQHGMTASWDGTLRLWNLHTGAEVRRFDQPRVHASTVAFSPDGKLALSGHSDNQVRLWDVDSGRLRHTFVGHTASVWIVAFSPDGQRALSGGVDKTIRLWDVPGRRPLHIYWGHEDGVTGVAFAPDGLRFVSSSADRTVRLWGLP